MLKKKNEGVNIEKHRSQFLSVGLLFIGSLTLASFAYTDKSERKIDKRKVVKAAMIDFLEVEKPKEIPPKVTPPKIKYKAPTPKIKVIKNTKKDPPVVVAPPVPPIITGPTTPVYIAPPIEDFPDMEASFPGGAVELQKWIIDNVNYPQDALQMGESGKVYLSFVVEIDGSISNIEIVRGVSESLDSEAKRLLRNMPNWIPGEARGKKARVRCRLPINFESQ